MDSNCISNIIAEQPLGGLAEIIIFNLELTALKPDPCDGFVGSA